MGRKPTPLGSLGCTARVNHLGVNDQETAPSLLLLLLLSCENRIPLPLLRGSPQRLLP